MPKKEESKKELTDKKDVVNNSNVENNTNDSESANNYKKCIECMDSMDVFFKKVVSIFVVAVVLVIIVLGIRCVIDKNYKEQEDGEVVGQTFIYDDPSTDMNTLSNEIAKTTVKEMKEENIEEKYYNDIVIALSGKVYNYSELSRFFNDFGRSFYYGEATNASIKVVNYLDEQTQDEFKIAVEIGSMDDLNRTETAKLIVTKNGEVTEYKYYDAKLNRDSSKNSDGEIMINYFIQTEDSKTDLFAIKLSGTTYYSELDMSFKADGSNSKLIHKKAGIDDVNVYIAGGTAKVVFQGTEYKLEEALSKGLLDGNYILSQASLDYAYGVCKYDYYKDGGSEVYTYQDYAIVRPVESKTDTDVAGKETRVFEYNNILIAAPNQTLEQYMTYIK